MDDCSQLTFIALAFLILILLNLICCLYYCIYKFEYNNNINQRVYPIIV